MHCIIYMLLATQCVVAVPLAGGWGICSLMLGTLGNLGRGESMESWLW